MSEVYRKDVKIKGDVRKVPVKVDGKDGIIVYDKLCADGPIDPKTGQPLINPKTGQEYPGANDDMAQLIHDYLVFLRGQDLKGNPRYGVLSLLAIQTPIYVYDHPAFRKIANTAFTDGIHCFVDASFMRKLVEQEEASDGRQLGVIFLLLHELMHKLLYHVDRLRNYPPVIANIAEDMVINGKLIKGFKLDPVKLLAEIGHGMKSEEADKYYKMAEETVAEMLLIQERQKKKKEEEQKKKQQQNQQGQGSGQGSGKSQKGNQQGQSSSQGSSSGSGDNGDEEGDSGEDSNKNDSESSNENGENGEYSDIHHVTPEELIRVIEEEGLQDTVGKALNLPRSDDVEAIGKKKDQAKLDTVDAIQTALSQAAKSGGDYPGQHIAESAADLVGGLERGKLTWKLSIRKHIMGEGLKLERSDEEADIPWLLTKETMGVEPWYSGSLIPHAPDETVVCLVDTSGSTSGGNMRKEFLQEALNLKKGVSSMGDTAREVILLSADTVLRGEPLIINEYNINKLQHEGVPIFGNGGTDFARCLKQTMELPLLKKKKVKSVIYFTDCCDFPPERKEFEEFLNKGMKIVFITTPSMWNEQWNRDVSSFAEVCCIEEGTQVDLEKKSINVNTRKNRT